MLLFVSQERLENKILILLFLIDTAKDSEYYKIIIEILFAPVIGLQTISELKRLIKQHLKHMKSLFSLITTLFDSCSIADKTRGTNAPSHVHAI